MVRIDLTGHDHHPDQEDASDNPEGELGLPALTNIPLLQKRKRVAIGPRTRRRRSIEDKLIAQIVDVGPRKELQGGADDADDEEDEQDEGEEKHEPREQLALRNVGDFDQDEENGERANGDAKGHDPRHPQSHPTLNLHEFRADAQNRAGGDEHHHGPQVQLQVGPVVLFANDDRGADHGCGVAGSRHFVCMYVCMRVYGRRSQGRTWEVFVGLVAGWLAG